MIGLWLLGGVDLRGHDSRAVRAVLSQPKRLAVLAHLAVASAHELHTRDFLLAVHWPELDQEHARAALRQTLYVLRRAVGEEVLVCYGDGLIGVDRTQLWCDATAFDEAYEASDYAAALELYGGELLAGFHITGALELERCIEQKRARLVARASAAAWTLADREEKRGDLVRSLYWMRRLMSVSPDDERALRRAVTLLHGLGDRVSAVRLYREFARRVAAEYGVEPAPETQALISALRLRAAPGEAVISPLERRR